MGASLSHCLLPGRQSLPSSRGDRPVSTPARAKRRNTHVWFAVYTIVVLAVFVLSILKQEWSIAATALLIAVVLAFGTRWLWRRR